MENRTLATPRKTEKQKSTTVHSYVAAQLQHRQTDTDTMNFMNKHADDRHRNSPSEHEAKYWPLAEKAASQTTSECPLAVTNSHDFEKPTLPPPPLPPLAPPFADDLANTEPPPPPVDVNDCLRAAISCCLICFADSLRDDDDDDEVVVMVVVVDVVVPDLAPVLSALVVSEPARRLLVAESTEEAIQLFWGFLIWNSIFLIGYLLAIFL